MSEPLRSRPDYGERHDEVNPYSNLSPSELEDKVAEEANKRKKELEKESLGYWNHKKVAKGLKQVLSFLSFNKEKPKFKTKDLVIIDGNKRTIYKVINNNPLSCEIENLRNGKILHIPQDRLNFIHEVVFDNHGRDASTAAIERYHSKLVVLQHNNENSIGRILSINPKGDLKVKILSNEDEEVLILKPYLFNKKWMWEDARTGKSITNEYRGQQLNKLV